MRWRIAVFLTILEMFLPLLFIIDVSLAEEKDVEEKKDFSPSFFQYKSEGRRDPFISLLSKKRISEPKKPAVSPKILLNSKYKLVGLVWDEKEAFAIIQEEKKIWVVKKGDVIDRLVVSEIKKDTGELILTGKEKIIKLKIGRK
ncbi:MAG: hypothetical protein U9O41_09670 [Candidatus Aerophobetes bacterium]|nr:hypothetical protein [Candidatus Aerophobetes bacterium]